MHIISNYTFKQKFCPKHFAAGDGTASRDQEAFRPSDRWSGLPAGRCFHPRFCLVWLQKRDLHRDSAVKGTVAWVGFLAKTIPVLQIVWKNLILAKSKKLVPWGNQLQKSQKLIKLFEKISQRVFFYTCTASSGKLCLFRSWSQSHATQ